MRFYLLIIFVCFAHTVFAQPGQRGVRPGNQQGGRLGSQGGLVMDVVISGLVVDESDNTPLPGAHVSLMHMMDTTRVYHVTTNDEGRFSLIVNRGRYYPSISYVGYEANVPDEPFAAISSANDMGIIKLVRGTLLNEVEITGERPQMRVRGDTLDYDARAFRLNPDASAEDLIRRLPGVIVDQGRVSAQGEDVRRVYVDGREFFGDDPSIALRNLPAEVIERIEIYDRMSDQSELTGFDDGQRNKTINIVTRLDSRRGQFGRIYSGYGADNRYQAGITTNIFKEDTRISILGMTNNVNEQNFSRDDIGSVIGGAVRGGRGSSVAGGRGGSGISGGTPDIGLSLNDFRNANNDGDNTTHSLGVNFSNGWREDKFRFTGSYFLYLANNMTDQITERQYLLDSAASQFYLENSKSATNNGNHRFNMRITYDVSEKSTFIFSPRATIRNNASDSYLEASNALSNDRLLSLSQTDYDSDVNGYNYSGSLVYRYRFNKVGRTISANMSANFNNNINLYHLDAINAYFSTDTPDETDEHALNDYLNQRSDSNTENNSLSTNINYTEPISERSMLQLSYNVSNAKSMTDRITNSWDEASQGYDIFELELSNRMSSDYLTQRGSLGYRLRAGEFNITLDLGYQHASLTADREFPYTYELERTFKNMLPGATLTYNMRRGKSIRLNYRTSTSPPSVNQLQDVVINSNPMLLRTGNPNLDHSYSHFFTSRYTTSNNEKLTNFFVFAMGSFTNDHIGNSTIIARRDTILLNGIELKKGSQLTMPVNLDGFVNLRLNFAYGFPFRLIKSNLNVNGGTSYRRMPSLINNQTSLTNNYTTSGGLSISSNISQNVDFSTSYSANYTIVDNSLQPRQNNNYIYQIIGVRFSLILASKWVIRNDFNHLSYNGLSRDFNQNYYLWNANIGRKLFRNNLGEITISVFDLMNQNDNITRNVTGTYVEDLRTNTLGRFFMLSLTYNLRHFRVRA
jgi:hypothetical protein